MTLTTSARIALFVAALGTGTADAQELPLTDARGLVAKDATIEAIDVLGRKAVRLMTTADAEDCLAFIPGVEFQDGTIDVDIALKVTTPPGVRMPGFIGVAFRARADGAAYDMFYVRPRNSRADDQSMRNHVVQYVAPPAFGWPELRQAWPWVYESHATVDPDAWTHLTIDVAGRTAKLFLNHSPEPSLIVDGLKGQDLRGAVALWGYASEEAYFSNLRITSRSPQPVKNGADAAGTWQVSVQTDRGRFEGTLRLQREDRALTGTWAGGLGQDLPVTGTWRDGYVELSFTGLWPPTNAPGPANAPQARPEQARTRLAGWIDGTTGNGRARVVDLADGRWTATRTP